MIQTPAPSTILKTVKIEITQGLHKGLTKTVDVLEESDRGLLGRNAKTVKMAGMSYPAGNPCFYFAGEYRIVD